MQALYHTIASLYDRAVSTPEDPQVKSAWTELARHSARWFTKARAKLEITVVDQAEPYLHWYHMMDDIRHGHLSVSSANCAHPLWDPWTNIQFRTVHDFYGHYTAYQRGMACGFDWPGEFMACSFHEQTIEPNMTGARHALLTECLGQAASLLMAPAQHVQKVAFLYPR